MPRHERLTDKPEPHAAAPTTNTAVDEQAALPEGALHGPFLGRQGDEHRQPSPKERRELDKIQTAQRDGGPRGQRNRGTP